VSAQQQTPSNHVAKKWRFGHGHGSACIRSRIWRGAGLELGCNMPSVSQAGLSGDFVDVLCQAVTGNRRVVVRSVGLALAAASLAACAQSNVASRHSAFAPPVRQAVVHREAPRVSVVRRHDAPSSDHLALAKPSGGGLASFYSEGQKTANGEQFDPNELTAAHPSLPFGTKLRVTNTNTGKSVTVRVNDRGPYVPGRVVDVSYSAAQALGMVRSGTANVKLDVVQ
jgi:rare lipoprotein A